MDALEYGDQPDYYNTAQIARYWDAVNDMEVAAGEGFGGADAWEAGSLGAYAVQYPASVHPTRFGFVVRMKIDTLPGAAVIILAVPDALTGSPPAPAVHLSCVLNADGTVSIVRGEADGTVLATSAAMLPDDGSTFRLAFTGLISPSSGHASVLFAADTDALAEITQCGGVNTDGAGTGIRRGVYLGGAPDCFLSYLYTQGSGTLPEHPLCDVLMPDVDSDLMEWLAEPEASPPNMADATDETPANDDTDYGYSETVGARYALQHATAPERVQYLGVRSVALVLNIEQEAVSPPASPPVATTFTFTPLIRKDGGGLSLATARTVGVLDWIGIDQVDAVDPFTALPWTTEIINAYAWGGATTV